MLFTELLGSVNLSKCLLSIIIVIVCYKLQGSRPGNPLSEAESLTFDPSSTDLALASEGADMVRLS